MDAEPRKRRTLPLAVLGAIACGAGVAVQSRINGQLGVELQDGYLGAVISFGSGLVILTILMLFIRGGRTGVQRTLTAIRANEIPWFYAVGGAAGGFFVLTQGLASAALGVALFSIGVVCGQTVSGVIIDRIGLGPIEPRFLTKQRLIGAALALAAVAIAASSQFAGESNPWLFLLPFVAGLGIAWLPLCLVYDYVAAGALVRIMTDHPPPAAGAYVVRSPGRHPGRKVQVLTEMMTDFFTQDPHFGKIDPPVPA